MARPTKQTVSTELAILAALKAGNTRHTSAALAGISHDTFSRMMKEEVFSDAVAHAEAHAESEALKTIQRAAKPRKIIVKKEIETEVGTRTETITKTEIDWRPSAWLLERRFAKHWRQQKSINVSTLSTEQILEALSQLEEDESEEEAGGGAEAEGSSSPEE